MFAGCYFNGYSEKSEKKPRASYASSNTFFLRWCTFVNRAIDQIIQFIAEFSAENIRVLRKANVSVNLYRVSLLEFKAASQGWWTMSDKIKSQLSYAVVFPYHRIRWLITWCIDFKLLWISTVILFVPTRARIIDIQMPITNCNNVCFKCVLFAKCP